MIERNDNYTFKSKYNHKLQDWFTGNEKVLFVTGLSCSGKTTLSHMFSGGENDPKPNVEVIHLDDVEFINAHIKSNPDSIILKSIRDEYLSKLIENNTDNWMCSYSTMSNDDFNKIFIDTFFNIMENLDPKKEYIIEGIQLYLHKELWDTIMNHSLYIIDEELETCYNRRNNYNLENDSEDNFDNLHTWYLKQYYYLHTFIDEGFLKYKEIIDKK